MNYLLPYQKNNHSPWCYIGNVVTCSKFDSIIDSNKLNEITTRIASRFNPDRIILFGSYANGTQTDSSDLDLIIIQESDLPPQNRGFDIRMSLLGLKIPFDILIYTKSEFEQEKENRFSFLSSAIKNSKLLYECVD